MSLEDPYKTGGGLQHVLLLWRSRVKTSYRRSIFATAKARNAPLLSVSAGYMFCMANNVLFLYLTTRWCIVGCLAFPADTTLVLCFAFPCQLFDGLTLEELEELQTEILQYQDLVGENG